MTAPVLTLVAVPAPFVCPPDHKHDQSDNCYTAHACRCGRCRQRNTTRKNEERRLKAYGRWERGRTSSARTIVHIITLMRFGYTQELIARAAGVNARTVWRIAGGHEARVHGRIASAILGVRPTLTDLDPHTRITARGAVRRVQALACLGWSVEALSAEMGVTRSMLAQRLNKSTVSVETHLSVSDLYERLWNTPPVPATPARAAMITRTRHRARTQGWVPPLAWDDIDTDEEPPTADADLVVDVIAVEFAVAGHRVELTREERHLALAQLHERGYFDPQLAQMLSVSERTIERDREHLNLPANYIQDREERSA